MSTIQLSQGTKDLILSCRIHPAETYEQCILRIFRIAKEDDSDLLTGEDMRDIEKGLQQIKSGKFVTLEQMLDKYAL